MRARRSFILRVITSGSVLFSFKESIESFFFITTMLLSKSLYVYFTLSVILNSDISSSLLVSRSSRKHIKQKFVVNFNQRDLNSNLIVETATNFRKRS